MAVPTPGRSGCSGRLHPSSQPGQGAPRLTNDQDHTAQNVPICVACTASHDVGKPTKNGDSVRVAAARADYAARRGPSRNSVAAGCGLHRYIAN